MKTDIKDQKLMYWLDQNSRATNKELGKKVGISEQAIGYKLKRLEEKGAIKRYVTFVNTPALGYIHYKVLLRLHNTDVKKEKEIIIFLVKNKNIRWVVSCSGKWDINFSILAKSAEDFTTIYRDIEKKIGDYISEKSVSILIKSPGLTKEYLLGMSEAKIRLYGEKKAEKELDTIDKKILKSISQNSRKNIVEIAEEINSTIDVVRYRLKKLEETKIISGYTVQLGFDKIGVLRYSVFFSLHKMSDEIERKMFEFAQRQNNIVFMLILIGTYDLSLELEVPSYQVLESIIKKFREEFANNISDFEIIFNTDEFKYNFYPF
ncbi:Lrp/AsnC family transcriptional regulator [Candidatus Pacearchaeota archaeon]|nr:Lrp/AsnC family transcriptional regulator [Candidatus Pacearchaeota archaeon]